MTLDDLVVAPPEETLRETFPLVTVMVTVGMNSKLSAGQNIEQSAGIKHSGQATMVVPRPWPHCRLES
jgi:hypothetical protein